MLRRPLRLVLLFNKILDIGGQNKLLLNKTEVEEPIFQFPNEQFQTLKFPVLFFVWGMRMLPSSIFPVSSLWSQQVIKITLHFQLRSHALVFIVIKCNFKSLTKMYILMDRDKSLKGASKSLLRLSHALNFLDISLCLLINFTFSGIFFLCIQDNL